MKIPVMTRRLMARSRRCCAVSARTQAAMTKIHAAETTRMRMPTFGATATNQYTPAMPSSAGISIHGLSGAP